MVAAGEKIVGATVVAVAELGVRQQLLEGALDNWAGGNGASGTGKQASMRNRRTDSAGPAFSAGTHRCIGSRERCSVCRIAEPRQDCHGCT